VDFSEEFFEDVGGVRGNGFGNGTIRFFGLSCVNKPARCWGMYLRIGHFGYLV